MYSHNSWLSFSIACGTWDQAKDSLASSQTCFCGMFTTCVLIFFHIMHCCFSGVVLKVLTASFRQREVVQLAHKPTLVCSLLMHIVWQRLVQCVVQSSACWTLNVVFNLASRIRNCSILEGRKFAAQVDVSFPIPLLTLFLCSLSPCSLLITTYLHIC